MEREALSLAMDGLERILGSFEKDGKFVRSSMIRNELFNEIHLLLVKAKKALAQPAQEPVAREWNFCERCGKRTKDLTVIHTCTPPQGNT